MHITFYANGTFVVLKLCIAVSSARLNSPKNVLEALLSERSIYNYIKGVAKNPGVLNFITLAYVSSKKTIEIHFYF
jgi:hypothetical protein